MASHLGENDILEYHNGPHNISGSTTDLNTYQRVVNWPEKLMKVMLSKINAKGA